MVSEPRPCSVAIVGGGITGLAAAYTLEMARRQQRAAVTYTLVEERDRLGGNIRTERIEGFVLDAGPDGFVAAKPHAAALCRAVGLEEELVETLPESRKVYVVHRGKLVPLPEGLMLTAPTRVSAMLRTPLLSFRGKLRMALEWFLPARPPAADESIADLVVRRLGREALEAFAEPLMAGIHAGSPEALSVRATFPQLAGMEREHGGLIRGALAMQRARRPRNRHGVPPSAFLSLRGGMGDLVSALERQLTRQNVITGAAVRSLTRAGNGCWRLDLHNGASIEADQVILAIPCPVSASLLEPHDAVAASLLRQVPYLSTVTVFLAYHRDQIRHPLDASGFVVPRREGMRITASTWVSCKWPARAPEGTVLLRVFLGGARSPEIAEHDDRTLVAIAQQAIGALMGVRGAPRWTSVYRHLRSSPQMTVGHLERMEQVRARLSRLGGLQVAGGGYQGVGLPDCIQQGESAAKNILRAAVETRD